MRGLLDDEPALRETAEQVRAALQSAVIEPVFRRNLHARLVAERARVIAGRSNRWERLFAVLRIGPMGTVPAAAMVLAAVLILGTVLLPRAGHPGPVAVAVSSTVSGDHAVDPTSQISVRFSGPMDHASVLRALKIEPATAVRTRWQGNDLLINPLHGFTPDAAYLVTVDGREARMESGAPVEGDLLVAFGTSPLAPAPGDRARPKAWPRASQRHRSAATWARCAWSVRGAYRSPSWPGRPGSRSCESRSPRRPPREPTCAWSSIQHRPASARKSPRKRW